MEFDDFITQPITVATKPDPKLQQFDAMVYDPCEMVRIWKAEESTPLWGEKGGYVRSFGLSGYLNGCRIRTIGIQALTNQVAMMCLEYPISVAYQDTLLICLHEPISRKKFMALKPRLQKMIGSEGNVLRTKDRVPYPKKIDHIFGRITLGELERRI